MREKHQCHVKQTLTPHEKNNNNERKTIAPTR
jgi:hypothetical protein